jgi:hypothetical protein
MRKKRGFQKEIEMSKLTKLVYSVVGLTFAFVWLANRRSRGCASQVESLAPREVPATDLLQTEVESTEQRKSTAQGDEDESTTRRVKWRSLPITNYSEVMNPMKKRLLVGCVVATAVFAAVFGAAATMGLTPDGLGANSAGVSACDSNGVTTSYANTWDATDNRYEVTSVTVKGVADTCDGLTMKVTLASVANADIGNGSMTIPTNAAVDHTVTPLSVNPAASAVANVHVVIG